MIGQILIALLLGICFGIFTGLIPGIHVNLISLILLSMSGYLLGFTTPLVLSVFIIAMAITHTFLDSIPSIFLGAPDADMALGVLPGHKLLLEGKGYEAVKLTVIGSFLALIVTICIIPLMIPLVPIIYGFIQPYIGYLLLFVIIYMIWIERGMIKKTWSLLIFILSGILGLIVLNWPNFSNPLFPMLSGLFGVSTLLLSLNNKTKLPEQKVTETIKVDVKKTSKAIGAAVFSGSLTGMLPGLGAAQASILGMALVGDIGNYTFMILIGGINTVNFAFSLVTLYTLEKARNGAVVVISELLNKISITDFIIFLAAALITGALAAILALKISKIAAKYITKIDYQKLCIGIIVFITALTLFFSHLYGLLVLIVSTAIGMTSPLVGVKRSHAMGCLMLPVILFFLL
ncbi:MAG: tripartite tricarboxylate transporter permease [Nanoarchaeota archaeon]